ncbi:MAG: hypothetical protein WD558_04975, partial [Pseudomonadales bacterium]
MTPASIILDLLRTYRHRGTAVKEIMAAGAMFDFSENAMRVNLSRLVGKGLVENFERGYYRISDHADPVNEFVEAWREGEDRVKPWDGASWLVVHSSHEEAPKRAWALDANGFRQIAEGLWARPDNLSLTHTALDMRLRQLGVDARSVLLTNAQIDKRCQDAWLIQFDLDRLVTTYSESEKALRQSAARLTKLPRRDALKESFHLGGEAVHILAKDPLLPSEVIDTTQRKLL